MAAKAPGLAPAGRRAGLRWPSLRAVGIDAWLAGLFVLISSIDLVDFMRNVGGADAGNVWMLLALVAALRLTQVVGITWPLVLLRRYPAVCFFLAAALASTLWSDRPSATLNRALATIGTSLMGIYIGHVLSQRVLLNTWLWTFCAVVGVSLVLFVVAPDIGGLRIEDHAGRLRGFATGKNILGPFLACASVLCAAATLQGAVWRPLGIALTAMNVTAAYLAYSATSLVALTAGLGAVVGLWLVVRMDLSLPVLLGLVASAAVAAAVLAVFNLEMITQLLGKQSNLTGRTKLWGLTFDALAHQPLYGFGHGAIWGRPETLDFLNAFSDDPRLYWSGNNHAHNGFINTAFDLGIPIAVLFAAYVIKVLFSAVRNYHRDRSAFPLFAAGYVTAFIVANLGENHILRSRSGVWMIFIAVAVSLTRSANGRRRKTRRRRARSESEAGPVTQSEELRERLRSALRGREWPQREPAAAADAPLRERKPRQRRSRALASQPARRTRRRRGRRGAAATSGH